MSLMIAAQQSIGSLFNWLFQAIAGILAFFYSIIPSYGAAIILLTVTVMIVLSPLTLKSTRSMIAMQRLAPELKRLQAKYKGDRQKLNEEMMKLYKEHNVSPLGGCLPMVLQLPVFLILYQVVRGLTNTIVVGHHNVLSPKYISHSSELYHNLIASHGHMYWLGMDLAKSATTVHGGIGTKLPYYVVILIAAGLQYLQMAQINNRNPQAAKANPQMMMVQKFMPLIFLFIYINIPAGVTLYFVISSLFRIGQQELMFRFDPVIVHAAEQNRLAARELPAEEPDKRRAGSPTPRPSWRERLAKAIQPEGGGAAEGPSTIEGKARERPRVSENDGQGTKPRKDDLASGDLGPVSDGRKRDNGRRGNGKRATGSPRGSADRQSGNGRPKPHPRSQAKKPRRPR